MDGCAIMVCKTRGCHHPHILVITIPFVPPGWKYNRRTYQAVFLCPPSLVIQDGQSGIARGLVHAHMRLCVEKTGKYYFLKNNNVADQV